MFRKYEKVSRLGQSDTNGILANGTVYVQPKLDGTNGSVWYDDGIIRAASRNRELCLGNDNRGFLAYVSEHKGISDLLEANPSWVLYGEWLVPHTIKEYREEAWNKFYVFDVFDGERYLLPDDFVHVLQECKVDHVPYYAYYIPDLADSISTYLMKDGKKGEGVVIKNYDFINKFGECKFAKKLNESFKVDSALDRDKIHRQSVELKIADTTVTNPLVQKTISKISPEGFHTRHMSQLLETVFYDVVHEELYDALKKYKWPPVDTRQLRHEIFRKVKELALTETE